MSVQLRCLGAGPQLGRPGRCGVVGTEPPTVLPVSLHNLPSPDVGCVWGSVMQSLVLLCFSHKLRVCGSPVSSKATGAMFPTALAHLVSLGRSWSF